MTRRAVKHDQYLIFLNHIENARKSKIHEAGAEDIGGRVRHCIAALRGNCRKICDAAAISARYWLAGNFNKRR